MRKYLVIFVLLTAITLSACGENVQPKQISETSLSQSAVGSFTKDDLVFGIDGVEFPLDTDVSPLLEVFGEEYTLTTAPSCRYDGEDKVFDYPFAAIYTYPKEGKDLIDEIFIFDGDYQTNKGIKIGSTLEDVKFQYGDDGYLVDLSYVYALSGNIEDLESPKLFFDLSDDKVTGISFYAASNLTK